MRQIASGAFFLFMLSACSSPNWTREIVDDGGGGSHVGANPSLSLYIDGSSQHMAVAYEDESTPRLKTKTRQGSSFNWNAFQTQIISNTGGRFPEVIRDPDGDIYFAFVDGGAPGGTAGPIVLASFDTGLGSPCPGFSDWDCETVSAGFNIDEPITAVYEDRGSKPHRIHIMWSSFPQEELWHAYRNVGSTTWNQLRVGGSIGNDDDAVDGDRPLSLINDGGGMRLLYTPDRGFQSASKVEINGLTSFGGWSVTTFKKFSPLSGTYDVLVNQIPTLSTLDTYWYARGGCSGDTIRISSETSLLGNGGTTLTPPVFDPSVFAACDPDLALDDNGFIYVATHRTFGNMLDVYRYNAGLGSWSGEKYTIIDNSADVTGLTPEIVFSPLSRELLTVYHDETNGTLKLATKAVP